MSTRTTEVKFKIELDENHLPIDIEWEAADNQEKSNVKAAVVSVWDRKEQKSMRIDLWTKDMMVDEMKQFFHQNLLSMADMLDKATGEAEMATDIREFSKYFGDKMGLFNP